MSVKFHKCLEQKIFLSVPYPSRDSGRIEARK